jgi:K+-transporting ATPase KdpF subunit
MSALGFFVAHMGAGDFVGLVIAAAICVYLAYALIRGERF